MLVVARTGAVQVGTCDKVIIIIILTILIIIIIIIIITMEICKAPTLRLKALNKHTHLMYIEMENVIEKKKKRKKRRSIYRQVQA